ncbi:MAG TPA: DnaJ domain-containing protein, partial [Bryobacteraceae bacterium]
MSVAKRDYYEVLGVSRDCDDSALKGAYRKLALQYHPDRNPNNSEAEERFKEAAEAYSILSDPQKRATYDRYGHQAVNGSASAGFDETTFADFG